MLRCNNPTNTYFGHLQGADDHASRRDDDLKANTPTGVSPVVTSKQLIVPLTNDQSIISELLKTKHANDSGLPSSQELKGDTKADPSCDLMIDATEAIGDAFFFYPYGLRKLTLLALRKTMSRQERRLMQHMQFS